MVLGRGRRRRELEGGGGERIEAVSGVVITRVMLTISTDALFL